MSRIIPLPIAAALVALLVSPAAAQVAGPFSSLRQDEARQESREGRRLDIREIERRVSAGRQGRILNAEPRGDVYVVRWEYPGGRVADITVDARTGRVLGER